MVNTQNIPTSRIAPPIRVLTPRDTTPRDDEGESSREPSPSSSLYADQQDHLICWTSCLGEAAVCAEYSGA